MSFNNGFVCLVEQEKKKIDNGARLHLIETVNKKSPSTLGSIKNWRYNVCPCALDILGGGVL